MLRLDRMQDFEESAEETAALKQRLQALQGEVVSIKSGQPKEPLSVADTNKLLLQNWGLAPRKA
jgi:hypothetical protein